MTSSREYDNCPNGVVYEIDGENFSTLEEFYDEISRVLIPGSSWGRNLDAFNDILRGGFGTAETFTLLWRNSELSRRRLGYPETVRQLTMRLTRCHPDNREFVAQELNDATNEFGDTVFDCLVKIILIHCPGGDEEEDGVALVLE